MKVLKEVTMDSHNSFLLSSCNLTVFLRLCGIWGYCSMFSMMRGYREKEIIMHVTYVLFWLGLQSWDSRYNTLCCYKIIFFNEEWEVRGSMTKCLNVCVQKCTIYRCHLEYYIFLYVLEMHSNQQLEAVLNCVTACILSLHLNLLNNCVLCVIKF